MPDGSAVAQVTQITETAIAKWIREAKERKERIERRDPRCPGLWLRIGKSGRKTWVLRCRDKTGKFRNFLLSDDQRLGLSGARADAQDLRSAIRKGADPTAEKREGRAQTAASPLPSLSTLKDVIDIYEERRGIDLKSWPHSRKRVDRVFAELMTHSVTELTPIDLQLAADKFHAKQSAAFAVRTLRPALRWAARRGLAPPDLSNLIQPATVKRRHRVLTRDELARLLPVLTIADTPYHSALLFMLLTLSRRSEAALARWRDVDLDSPAPVWVIPTTKSGQPHQVPLSRQAVDLLRRFGPAQPDDLIFAANTGGELTNWDRATKQIQEESETVGWHRHDLRRTGATMLGELGTEPHVIESTLNHAAIHSALAATYNRSRYRPAVSAALQKLADFYDALAKPRGGTS